MTNREIYSIALSVLGETAEDCPDYEERVPALVAIAVREYAAQDAEYRAAQTGESTAAVQPPALLPLDGQFPLSDRFATAVAYRLSGMLLQRENASFAEECYAHAEASVQCIFAHEVPAKIHPIRSVQ
jgi:hypothetical protein